MASYLGRMRSKDRGERHSKPSSIESWNRLRLRENGWLIWRPATDRGGGLTERAPAHKSKRSASYRSLVVSSTGTRRRWAASRLAATYVSASPMSTGWIEYQRLGEDPWAQSAAIRPKDEPLRDVSTSWYQAGSSRRTAPCQDTEDLEKCVLPEKCHTSRREDRVDGGPAIGGPTVASTRRPSGDELTLRSMQSSRRSRSRPGAPGAVRPWPPCAAAPRSADRG
jgi:hypothetical protein